MEHLIHCSNHFVMFLMIVRLESRDNGAEMEHSDSTRMLALRGQVLSV
jgi:hypothetical protein